MKRYGHPIFYPLELVPKDDGEVVLYTDHAAEVERLQERVRVLEEALESIAVIQDCPEGGDWDEIKLAREIAQAALAQPQQKELE